MRELPQLEERVPSIVTEPDLQRIRYEWRAEIAQSELRMTKWMFITAIGVVSVILFAAMPPLHGIGGLLFIVGSAGQMYAVARM